MLKNHYGNNSVLINNKPVTRSVIAMAIVDIPDILKIESLAHTHPWSEKTFLNNFGKHYINHTLMIDNKIVGYFIASYV